MPCLHRTGPGPAESHPGPLARGQGQGHARVRRGSRLPLPESGPRRVALTPGLASACHCAAPSHMRRRGKARERLETRLPQLPQRNPGLGASDRTSRPASSVSSPSSDLARPQMPGRIRGEVGTPGVRAIDADRNRLAPTRPIRTHRVVDNGSRDPAQRARSRSRGCCHGSQPTTVVPGQESESGEWLTGNAGSETGRAPGHSTRAGCGERRQGFLPDYHGTPTCVAPGA
jgi:hypothetical protein